MIKSAYFLLFLFTFFSGAYNFACQSDEKYQMITFEVVNIDYKNHKEKALTKLDGTLVGEMPEIGKSLEFMERFPLSMAGRTFLGMYDRYSK